MCLITVLETTSLPPLVRSSEMPRPVNPSMTLFSTTTDVPASIAVDDPDAIDAGARPVDVEPVEPHGAPRVGRVGDVDDDARGDQLGTRIEP